MFVSGKCLLFKYHLLVLGVLNAVGENNLLCLAGLDLKIPDDLSGDPVEDSTGEFNSLNGNITVLRQGYLITELNGCGLALVIPNRNKEGECFNPVGAYQLLRCEILSFLALNGNIVVSSE